MSVKLQTNWSELRETLNARLKTCDLGPNVLSVKANISYWAARRFLQSGALNYTSTALRLCSFFEISVDTLQEVQNGELQDLAQLIEQVWDGTPSHAALLRKLISSTQPFKVEERH